MTRAAVAFIAVLLTAITLIPAGAHVAELPAKMAMDRDDYFTVQDIYRGWSLFGIALVGALLSTLALALVMRRFRAASRLAALSFLALAASLAVFFVWTYPTNLATENWTVAPEGWEALRSQWEYSHAAAAALNLIALCACVLAVISGLRRQDPAP